MRAPGLIFVAAALLLAALATRAASSGGLPLPPPVPAPDDWATLRLPKLAGGAPVLSPTAQMAASAFLPKNLLISTADIPPPETRTPAQLEALLATYAGTWRGESTWYSSAGKKILRYPTEMVYRLEQQNGRRVLTCAITYTIDGAASTSRERLWVENGRIISEVSQGGAPARYIAGTDHEKLVWHAADSAKAVLDFAETETLRLTADGGQITTLGFEVEHGPDQDAFVHETSTLKLVK